MRKIKEVLRLHFEAQLSERQIANICALGKGTVRCFLERAEAAQISWPLPPELDDTALEKKLFPPLLPPPAGPRPQPDYASIHRELRKPNVTLQLLWEEYKQQHPTGYGHSRFNELYNAWSRRLDLVLRQDHGAGEKMFVDHAGQTVAVIDRLTGDTRDAYVFVAVLGASSYTYAEATWTRGLRDWIGSHVRTFEFFQGCTRLVVPDNWKSGVKQPCYYEPELNPTYNDLAVHYGVGILPARPYHARDKAKVEAGLQVVQRWVLAALRKRQFFSLAEVNEAISELREKLNRRPFRKLPGTREELYRSVDVPALRPLPVQPYVFAEWKRARVNSTITSSWSSTTTAFPTKWWARKSMCATPGRRWKSCIKASAWLRMRAAVGPANIPRCRNIGPKPTRNTWSGRRHGLWIGPPPSDRSRRNWPG